ncbi:MAG TPA: iron-containing alcohol dehydrogenase [Flexilinea sp.]|nr:iron-containing alcohol dehydrogenase [Flexilinea sp.]HQN62203.1 iron-containing alcohol dehydrogenase [Flexilinea sp.]
MMRPMKLAGSELMFGRGCLEYIHKIPEKRVFIVIGGSSMEKNGILAKVENLFHDNGAETAVFRGVEPDPSFKTVLKGAAEMLKFEPDLIVGLGGGSVMDAGKAMWVCYEHPEIQTLDQLLTANPFPKLRKKARYLCIPTTAGTASEVSRSVVITDDEKGLKHGLGNMEMMPDIAIDDPEVTIFLPPHITAETGMDALTHALEALVSNRANYLSDILAVPAALDIIRTLPIAYANGKDMDAREMMLNASMTAGLAFTNVSLGIVHSLAQTIGGYFHISHGLADAIILPYIIRYNAAVPYADKKYRDLAAKFGKTDLSEIVDDLNRRLHIPSTLREPLQEEARFESLIPEMAVTAKNDGCTKTNPIIPDVNEFAELLKRCYYGEEK